MSTRTQTMTEMQWSPMLFYRALSLVAHQRLTLMLATSAYSAAEQCWQSAPSANGTGYAGIATWFGLKEAVIPFEREARAAGLTHYSLFKILRFAWTWISSFSAFPSWISMDVGCIFSCGGFLYLLRVVYLALWTNVLVHGWGSVVALECAFLGNNSTGDWSSRRPCRSHV